MRDILPKTNNSTSLDAGDFNASQDELENVVTTADDTLDPAGGGDTDLKMLAKAISGYSGSSWAYTDSGTANAHVVALTTNMDPVTKYFDNMMVVYVPGNTNTSTTVNTNVESLGNKGVRKIGGGLPPVGSIPANRSLFIKYNDGAGYFEIMLLATHTHVDDTEEGLLALGIRDSSRNMIIKNNSGTPDEQVDIDGDEVILQDVNGGLKRLIAINFTADNTASGENGLFTGSVAVSTLYYIWLTAGASGSTSGLHLSPVLATVLGDAPSGFEDFGALVGYVFTDGTSDFVAIGNRSGATTQALQNVLTGGTASSLTAQSLLAVVASGIKTVSGIVTATVTSGTVQIELASDNDGKGSQRFDFNNAAGTFNFKQPFTIPVFVANTIYWRVVGGTGTGKAMNIDITADEDK